MNKTAKIKYPEGTIVDVRTPSEFRGGSVSGAKNIPLNEISDRLNELKAMKTPLILCCASGMRSGQAEVFLKNKNVDCFNAGSWLEVNHATK